MKNVIQVKKILEFLQEKEILYEYMGDLDLQLEGFSSVTEYQPKTITWIKSAEKFVTLSDVNWKRIDFVIADKETAKLGEFCNILVCDSPKYTFYQILEYFFKPKIQSEPIGKNTVLGEHVILGRGVTIGNNCSIGNNVHIGDNSHIYHNVVIHDNVQIGNNCYIKSGTVIGEEGYGYSEKDGRYYHAPHFGKVIIEDNVEIGSNDSIDRGSIGDTIIGEGTKIDNLCHIGHNVQIGKNVRIVAGTVIGGSAKIESNVYLAPGVIVKNQLSIGEESIIGIGSVVMKNADKGIVYLGVPAKPVRRVGKENL